METGVNIRFSSLGDFVIFTILFFLSFSSLSILHLHSILLLYLYIFSFHFPYSFRILHMTVAFSGHLLLYGQLYPLCDYIHIYISLRVGAFLLKSPPGERVLF